MRMTWLKTIAMAACLALGGGGTALAQQAAPAADTTAAAPAAAPAAATPTSPLLSQDGAPPMTIDPKVGQPTPGAIDLQPNVTPTGVRAHNMHNHLLMPIIIAISLFVLVLLVICIFRFRASVNPIPSKTSHNTVLEVVWTLVPIIILVVIAVPSIGLLAQQYTPPPGNAVTLKATGNQWYWTYEYPDNGDIQITANMLKEKGDVSPGERYRTDADGPPLLAADNRVVLPVGVPIKLETTASDVIHSWAVPAFWIKLDAVPGRINTTSFTIERPGVYFGQCSELCGTNHGFMPITVEAVPPAEFAAWVKAKGGSMPGTNAAAPDAGAATTTPAPNLPPTEPGTVTAPTTSQPATNNAPGASKSDI